MFDVIDHHNSISTLLAVFLVVSMVCVCSNLAVFVFKMLAYGHTHSAAMLSEAIHSLADLINQVNILSDST